MRICEVNDGHVKCPVSAELAAGRRKTADDIRKTAASPEPNAPRKKTRGPGAISAALAAAAPAAAPPPPSPSPPPLPTEPLPFLVTNVEHDGVLWVWGRTEASGDAQSGTVGTWRRIPGVTFH